MQRSLTQTSNLASPLASALASTVEERFAEEAKQLRAAAGTLPHGPARDGMLRKARQDETASHLFEWLNSPGLRSPT